MSQSTDRKTVEIVIKGQQATASLREIQSASRVLNAELKKLPVNSQEFKDKAAQLREVNARLKAITDDVRNVGNVWKDVAKGFTTGTLITSAISAIKGGIDDSMQLYQNMQVSLKNLQAITGVSAQDLQYYNEKAHEMGVAVEGGARAVVEAFKLIGSAKPELLDNKEAMSQVTEAAILLSQAAGLDLPDAATRLTDALNQFGAPASEAAKYVDVLAAAAKYGAAEVPDVTEALLKFGVAAKSSNININESAAVIELLAEKGLKGAEAGTQLRNVFAKMSASEVLPKRALELLAQAGVNVHVLSDNSLSLQDRLKELSKIQGNAAAITETFGLENKVAGEVLINNLPRLDDLTKKVGEQGVAQEQAALNTDTETQRLLEQENRINNLSESIGSKLTPAWRWLKEVVLEAVEGMVSAFDLTFNKTSLVKDMMQRLGLTSDQTSKLIQAGYKDMSGGTQILIDRTSGLISTMNGLDKIQTNLSASYHAGKATLTDYSNTIDYLNKQMLSQEVTTNSGATRFYLLKDAISKLTKEYNSLKTASAGAITGNVPNSGTANASIRTKAEEKADKKIEDARKKLLEKLAAIEIEYQNKGLDAENRELSQVQQKYQKLLKEAGNDKDLRLRIQQDYSAETMQIIEKQAEAEQKINAQKLVDYQKLQDEVYNATLSENDRELVAEMNKWDELILKAEAAGIDVTQLRQAEADAIAAIVEKQGQKEIDITQKAEDEKEQIRKQKAKKIVNETQQFISQINGIMSSYQQIQQNREAQELKRNDNNLNQEKQKYDQLLAAKLISQKEYDAAINKATLQHDKQQAAIQKAAFERQQKAAVAKAIIDGALGVAQIWATYGDLPYLAAALTLVEAAAIATQIQAIESAPTPYAKGGYNKKSNDPQGYTAGATLYTGSASGRDFIAGEAGQEWIAPNWMVKDPQTASIIEHLETIRKNRSFASGGFTSFVNKVGKSVVTGTNNIFKERKNINTVLEHLDDTIASLHQTLSDISANGIEAHLSYDNFKNDLAKIDNAKASSRVG